MLLCLPWKASQLIIQVHEGRPEPAVWTPRISALCRAGSLCLRLGTLKSCHAAPCLAACRSILELALNSKDKLKSICRCLGRSQTPQ